MKSLLVGDDTEPKVRVLLADDSPAFLAAASSFLRLHQNLRVIGRVVSGNDTLTQTLLHRPEVLIIDPFSPDATLWDVKQSPRTCIVVLSERGDGPFRELVRSMGADAFIIKDDFCAQLLPVIDELVFKCDRSVEVSSN